jgi:hypothetical protein
VLEVFAWTGGTPAAIKAGKVTKEPPPASAFMAPARSPAENVNSIASMETMLGRGARGRNLAIPVLDFG